MTTLTILRGPPGSGKTTEARRMVADGEADVYYEADQWMVDQDGRYAFNARRLVGAHMCCQVAVFRAILDGLRVVVSNTSIEIREFAPYLALADAVGYPVRVRVMRSRYQNEHGVPQHKVDQMAARMEPWP